MNHGEPLVIYLDNRLGVLFLRRYQPYWHRYNLFKQGATVSKRPSLAKTAIHWETWRVEPDGHRELHYGLMWQFRFYGSPHVSSRGFIKIADDVVMTSMSLVAKDGQLFWRPDQCYQLANPRCVDHVVDEFKTLFPIP